MKTRKTQTPIATATLALLICTSVIGAAQQGPGSRPEQKAAASAVQDPSDERREGITVHGHWVIDVLNHDGSLASRHEFENALDTVLGPKVLVGLLARKAAPGFWRVILYGQGNNGPCGTDAAPNVCTISESGVSYTADSKNLVVTASADGLKLILSGSVTAMRNASVSGVGTQTYACAASNTPAAPCGNGSILTFTGSSVGTGMAAPVPVQTGQTIQVTVTISFS